MNLKFLITLIVLIEQCDIRVLSQVIVLPWEVLCDGGILYHLRCSFVHIQTQVDVEFTSHTASAKASARGAQEFHSPGTGLTTSCSNNTVKWEQPAEPLFSCLTDRQ